MQFSVIIPVYNRADELDELLASMVDQPQLFEVIVVDDGSQHPCNGVVEKFSSRLDIHYLWKSNSGPAGARNFGAKVAKGDYFIFLDSDVVLPNNYFDALTKELELHPCDAFGGPDRASDDFTPLQKAINYSMTSILTTGGIRGAKKAADKFYPRSFNMGIKSQLFNQLCGFADMRFGEDVDFSYRIVESGAKAILFKDAWVYHKRRSNFRQFFKQVFNSGSARIVLNCRHPGTLKLVHMLPALFVICISMLLIISMFAPSILFLLLALIAIVFVDSAVQTRSLRVAPLAVCATFIQLIGYGVGFIAAWWRILVRGAKTYSAFNKTFYE